MRKKKPNERLVFFFVFFHYYYYYLLIGCLRLIGVAALGAFIDVFFHKTFQLVIPSLSFFLDPFKIFSPLVLSLYMFSRVSSSSFSKYNGVTSNHSEKRGNVCFAAESRIEEPHGE